MCVRLRSAGRVAVGWLAEIFSSRAGREKTGSGRGKHWVLARLGWLEVVGFGRCWKAVVDRWGARSSAPAVRRGPLVGRVLRPLVFRFVQICPDQSGWGSIRAGVVRVSLGDSRRVQTARKGASRLVTEHGDPSDRGVSGECMRTAGPLSGSDQSYRDIGSNMGREEDRERWSVTLPAAAYALSLAHDVGLHAQVQ